MTLKKNWLLTIYLTIVYKTFHLKDGVHNGWFIKKNPITMIFISPILLPFFMLYGIVHYYKWSTNYYFHWVEGEKRNLSFKDKLSLKYKLYR